MCWLEWPETSLVGNVLRVVFPGGIHLAIAIGPVFFLFMLMTYRQSISSQVLLFANDTNLGYFHHCQSCNHELLQL